jgi:uncharacterized protein with HEPN domain
VEGAVAWLVSLFSNHCVLPPEVAASISEIRRIINFRNVMVHGYCNAQIVPDTVWGVIEKDLILLHQQVRQLIVQESESGSKQ